MSWVLVRRGRDSHVVGLREALGGAFEKVNRRGARASTSTEEDESQSERVGGKGDVFAEESRRAREKVAPRAMESRMADVVPGVVRASDFRRARRRRLRARVRPSIRDRAALTPSVSANGARVH